MDNNIDIVFLDAHGEPYGRVWHPKLGSTNLIRRRQLEIYDTSEGLNPAKEWGGRKLNNQVDLLSRLKKAREEQREEIEAYVRELEHSREQMQRLRGNIDARRQLVRGSMPVSKTDERVLELQAAMEILAEVFGTDVSEIDMMLKQRYEERLQGSSRRAGQQQPFLKHRCDEAGEWPREFCLAE